MLNRETETVKYTFTINQLSIRDFITATEKARSRYVRDKVTALKIANQCCDEELFDESVEKIDAILVQFASALDAYSASQDDE